MMSSLQPNQYNLNDNFNVSQRPARAPELPAKPQSPAELTTQQATKVQELRARNKQALEQQVQHETLSYLNRAASMPNTPPRVQAFLVSAMAYNSRGFVHQDTPKSKLKADKTGKLPNLPVTAAMKNVNEGYISTLQALYGGGDPYDFEPVQYDPYTGQPLPKAKKKAPELQDMAREFECLLPQQALDQVVAYHPSFTWV